MEKQLPKLSIEQLEEFYFEAALHGFAHAKYLGIHHEGAPVGWLEYQYHREGLQFREVVRHDPHTLALSGIVTITLKLFPIFHLSYGGRLGVQYLDYYKEVLREAFDARTFHGGRGPAVHFGQDDLPVTYSNTVIDLVKATDSQLALPPTHENRLRHFSGLEELIDDMMFRVGLISYSGCEQMAFAGVE